MSSFDKEKWFDTQSKLEDLLKFPDRVIPEYQQPKKPGFYLPEDDALDNLLKRPDNHFDRKWKEQDMFAPCNGK